MQQVRRCARSLCAILICTDGFAAYPKSIIKAFRYKVKDTPGPGASKKVVWSRLYIGTSRFIDRIKTPTNRCNRTLHWTIDRFQRAFCNP